MVLQYTIIIIKFVIYFAFSYFLNLAPPPRHKHVFRTEIDTAKVRSRVRVQSSSQYRSIHKAAYNHGVVVDMAWTPTEV